MEHFLTIAGIRFRFTGDCDLTLEPQFLPFVTPDPTDWDVQITIRHDFSQAPRPAGPMLGQDILLEYYPDGDGLICLAKGGWKGPLSISASNLAFSEIVCYTNKRTYPSTGSMSHLFRMIPMRMILQRFDVLFFHASQIALGDTGILYTAPSGTGKTTQARLWQTFRDARIICNDRTLVRNGLTYGFPFDGSEPVFSSEVHKIGALVSLSQHKINYVQRMTPSAALASLLPQMVIDTWNPDARFRATEQIMSLMQTCPIYHLACTPDRAAVECLARQLSIDGVIV